MAVIVVVVIRIGDHRGAGRVERNLEIIEQVPVCIAERPALADVAAVDKVIADLRLPEGRIVGGGIERLRVEDVPVGVVIVGSARCPVPDDAD